MTRWILLLSLVVLAGCGGAASGPARFAVSGSVTYDGKPLPGGAISMEPAERGPSASAVIVDGKYTIPASDGIMGGTYTIRVDPPILESGSTIPPDMANFSPYSESRDLPKATAVVDINVPKATR